MFYRVEILPLKDIFFTSRYVTTYLLKLKLFHENESAHFIGIICFRHWGGWLCPFFLVKASFF